MIGQVLTFLREAREPRERERIDLLSLVETAVDEAVNGGAPVALVREDVGIVEGDVSALLRLLGNLIGNAVKYGKRADVSVFAGHGELRVEIEDDGPGLSTRPSVKPCSGPSTARRRREPSMSEGSGWG